MALPAGTRLGPYEILGPLGAGGMGEVYRARDTRLGRDVAIKVLPAHLIENAEVRTRFDRETLADKIARGPLPQHEVLKLGSQIADALDRAHRAGIVHRDFKPQNVMVTKAGAKLMDFGLARTAVAPGLSPGSGSTGVT